MKFCPTCSASYPSDFQTCPKDQATLQQISELQPGMIIRNKYIILNKIGSGGMASVYRAQHKAFDEIRAIKVVSPELADNSEFLTRFRTEARITRRLHHPNAVWVEDLDETDDGRPFIVMEYVDGKDLRSVIERTGPVPITLALNIAAQVTAALAAAHQLKITHRDIKPDNILLTTNPDGSYLAKVLDFGIAKAREGSLAGSLVETRTGILVGTPQYMSPEQAMGKRGDQLDGRSDLYSLGIVIYEMITGQLPFESDTPMGYVLSHLNTKPVPPHQLHPELKIPQALSKLLMKALEKEPEKRFRTAEEMLTALKDPERWSREQDATIVSRAAVPAPPPTVVARPSASAAAPAPRVEIPRKAEVSRPSPPPPVQHAAPVAEPSFSVPSSSRSFLPAVLGGILVIALAAGGFFYWKSRPAQPSAQPAASAPAPAQTQLISDEQIRNSILAAIPMLGTQFAKYKDLNVRVENGKATLTGNVNSAEDRAAVADAARKTLGVKEVVNDIIIVVRDEPPPREKPAVVARRQPAPPPERPKAARDDGGSSRVLKDRAQQFVTTGKQQLDNGEYAAAVSSFQQALKFDASNATAQNLLRRAQQAQKTEEDILKRRQ